MSNSSSENTMAECHQIEELLSDYLDRNLPPDSCERIDAHLRTCAACGDIAQSLRDTVQLCREYRAGSRPGPLPPAKQEEMKELLESALARMRTSDH